MQSKTTQVKSGFGSKLGFILAAECGELEAAAYRYFVEE